MATKRWGEYFAVIATSIFLPLEIRDLLSGVTFTRAGALVINLAAVIYLLLSKHLFGLRGGRAAYDRGAARRATPRNRAIRRHQQSRPRRSRASNHASKYRACSANR